MSYRKKLLHNAGTCVILAFIVGGAFFLINAKLRPDVQVQSWFVETIPRDYGGSDYMLWFTVKNKSEVEFFGNSRLSATKNKVVFWESTEPMRLVGGESKLISHTLFPTVDTQDRLLVSVWEALQAKKELGNMEDKNTAYAQIMKFRVPKGDFIVDLKISQSFRF